MTAIIVIVCIAIFIALLLSVRIVLRIKHEEKLVIYLRILFVKIKLYPNEKKKKRYPQSMSRKKAEKIKRELAKEREKKKEKKDADHKVGKKKEETDVISLLSIMATFIKNFVQLFMNSVRIKASKLHVTVASDSAAKTAILYGAVSQAVNVIFPLIDDLKPVKKLPTGKNLSVETDFLSEKPSITADITIYVTVGGALKALLVSATRTFKKVADKQTAQTKNDKK